jgi:hypothetical protein
VSVTCVFGAKLAEQVVGQMIPAGLLVTAPVPVTVTVTGRFCAGPKVAVTLVAAAKVTVQVLVPEQAPLQPVKELFVPGVAVSVTCAFGAKPAEQVVGQLIPAGLLITVPVPLATVTVKPGLKVAPTLVAAFTLQAPVPEQPPLQLAK